MPFPAPSPARAVATLRASLRASLRAAWLVDDPALVRAGYQGERWLARARVALFAALLVVPLSWVVTRDLDAWEVRVGATAAIVAVLIATLLAWAARHPRLPRWFGLVSGVLDLSLVSGVLVAFLAVGQPMAAVNSTITFELYFVGLAATALRYDWRVCALAGLTAVAQYLGIAWFASTHWDLRDALWPSTGYGYFRWSTVVGRAVLLALAAALAAALVARAGRLRAASVRDRLTGVANRAYFDERLAEELGRARRSGQPLAVALVDLDHFKQLNDRHGHLAGDEVLRAVAASLRVHVRGHDVVARYGGEEFGLLLVDTPVAAAVERLEALRAALAALRIPLSRGGAVVTVTASAGVAAASETDDDEVAVLHLADERLYTAKAAGRDRVVGPPGARVSRDAGWSPRGRSTDPR